MTNSSNSDPFDAEHAKRDKRISPQQLRIWADGLIACLADSIAYRAYCTPAARLQEQRILNQLVEQWKSQQGANDNGATADSHSNSEL